MNKKQLVKLFLKNKELQKSAINVFIDDLIDRKVLLPKDRKNYVGIEIECSSPYNERKIHELLLKHNLVDYIQVGEDGSISGKGHPYELRVLICENEFNTVITKIGKFLKEGKFSTNNSCGLHVHLDMRQRNKRACFDKLFKMQDVMYRLVKPNRWRNTYCEKTTEYSSEKYQTINALGHRNTIEIRLHHGTTDAKEIKNWINFLLTIIKSVKPDLKKIQRNKKISSYLSKTMDKNGNYLKYIAGFEKREKRRIEKLKKGWPKGYTFYDYASQQHLIGTGPSLHDGEINTL